MSVKKIKLPAFQESDPLWNQFYAIFRQTLNPDLEFRVFKAYFMQEKPVCIDLSFVYDQQRLIGFISTSFYRKEYLGRKITIARGAAGVLPGERGGKLPSFLLCRKYIAYKFRHPGEEIYITGYMANPILYSMMCKYTHRVYPKAGITTPAKITALKDAILQKQRRVGHHLVQLHFQVKLWEVDRERIDRSTDRDIRFYCALNPGYGQHLGLFTLIPLDLPNIASSISWGLSKAIRRLWSKAHRRSRPLQAVLQNSR